MRRLNRVDPGSITIRVCHFTFLEHVVHLASICFADSTIIIHVVQKTAEVPSCDHWNISRAAVEYIYNSSALVTVVPYKHTYIQRIHARDM